MIVSCYICKKQFKTYLSLIKRGRGKNCSRICANISKSRIIIPEERKIRIGQNSAKYWLNKKMSLSTKNKMSRIAKTFVGDRAKHWKGDKVGYGGVHDWIKKEFGTPTKCTSCGIDGLEGKKIHWHNISGNYTRERFDWVRLCASCHLFCHRYGRGISYA